MTDGLTKMGTLWRFIVAYKQYTGQQLSYTALNKEPAQLQKLLSECLQDKEAPEEIKALATTLYAEWQASMRQQAVTASLQADKTAETISKPNFEPKPYPKTESISGSQSYRKIIGVYLKNEHIYLKERQILDQLLIDEGLSEKHGLSIENNERAHLGLQAIDWEKEFLFAYHQMLNQEILSEQERVSLYSTYVRTGRLSLETAKAIIEEYKSLKPKPQRALAKWWMPVAAMFFVVIGALIAGLQQYQNPDYPGVLSVQAAEENQKVTTAAPIDERDNWLSKTPVISIAGSNTIGASLAPELAQRYLAEVSGGESSIIRGEQANESLIVPSVANSYDYIKVAAHGSSSGFSALLSNSANIAAASRPVKEKEVLAIENAENHINALKEYIIGLDGIAIIVNPVNPIKTLSKTQISAIFAGEITRWETISEDYHGPIAIYSRNSQSGTFDTFNHLVMNDAPLTSLAQRFESNQTLSNKVASDPMAIGFVPLPAVANAKLLSVSDGDAMPIYPTPFTIATEDYPLTRRLYFYTASTPPAAVQSFIASVLGDKGQLLVRQAGFVDMMPNLSQVASQQEWPTSYRDNIQDAERVSLNFRFQPGTLKLDTRAEQDLARITQLLAFSHHKDREVLLFGFSDAAGDPGYNQYLSQQRAQLIADELIARGIKPTLVKGMGSAVPIADNRTAGGREKNRRVEIWLR